MTARLELALLPAEAAGMEADCYIVIDELRATTTMAVLFARGLRDLVVVDEIGAARRRAAQEGRLQFGEVGGLRPEGFDHGNSPLEAGEAPVHGQGAVLFTTNGTRAVCAVAGRGAVFAGALANLAAVVERARAFERVAIVCAGTAAGRRFAVEDFAAAGRFGHAFAQVFPGLVIGDACRVAMTATASHGEAERLIAGAAHARKLVALGLGDDIEFACRADTSNAVPTVVEHGKGWARLEAAG